MNLFLFCSGIREWAEYERKLHHMCWRQRSRYADKTSRHQRNERREQLNANEQYVIKSSPHFFLFTSTTTEVIRIVESRLSLSGVCFVGWSRSSRPYNHTSDVDENVQDTPPDHVKLQWSPTWERVSWKRSSSSKVMRSFEQMLGDAYMCIS